VQTVGHGGLEATTIVNQTVLVVDDEERIRSSIRGILSDEGYRVLETGEAPRAMEIIARENPALVLLDVWMPGLDGLELLRQIKHENPQTPVIMISGHANIQNAVAATRLGAADFLEKPFSVNGLLAALDRVLPGENADNGATPRVFSGNGASVPRKTGGTLSRIQRTVAQSVVIAGQGLHSGLKSGVILHPAPPGSGIVFSSLIDQATIAARLENVAETGYNTTLNGGGQSIRTVEHLMSAFHGLGITNVLVKTDDEVPALDGSAAEFCRHLRAAGIMDQSACIEPVTVTRPVSASVSGESIRIEPADRLIIDYTLEYPPPIAVQRFHFELDSPESYEREVAPARTFGFVSEFHKLASMGLARGGRLDNLILVDDEKVVNTTLRFPDEFARHKVLDLIGDLYLLGRPMVGHIIASKTGHSDNLALLRRIAETL
jgi:UDP-3-O-[3-hydroxymyristoyl] N-acetylglucosamine deacetylase